MNKIFILLMILLCHFLIIGTINGQEDTPRFLFEDTEIMLSGFGGATVLFSTLGDEFAVSNGGGGALLLNQKYFIGGYGLGLSTAHYSDCQNVIDYLEIANPKYTFDHGGLWVGYIHQSHRLLHLGSSLKVGWGQIALCDEFYEPFYLEGKEAKNNIMVFSPQIEAEANFTSWMKVNLGIGYQIVTGIERQFTLNGVTYDYYKKEDFNKPYITIAFLFGWFNQ
ncbi:MAG: hypothetical protein RQ866_02945 [Bacteroidales bacterium]|nr:hypothetical protein [Bacteroidales bacterium]